MLHVGIISLFLVVATFLGFILGTILREKDLVGATCQVTVGDKIMIWDFASNDEIKAFYHGIISREREKGKEVRVIKFRKLYDKSVEPIGLKEAYRIGRMVADMTAREYLAVKGW